MIVPEETIKPNCLKFGIEIVNQNNKLNSKAIFAVLLQTGFTRT